MFLANLKQADITCSHITLINILQSAITSPLPPPWLPVSSSISDAISSPSVRLLFPLSFCNGLLFLRFDFPMIGRTSGYLVRY